MFEWFHVLFTLKLIHFFIDDDFDVRTLQTPELKDIFNHHRIPYGPNMNRYELIRLFRQQIFRQRDLILNDLIDSHQKRASSTNPSYSAKASHPNTDPDDLFVSFTRKKKKGSFLLIKHVNSGCGWIQNTCCSSPQEKWFIQPRGFFCLIWGWTPLRPLSSHSLWPIPLGSHPSIKHHGMAS